MSDAEWLKLESDEIDIIVTSLELCKKFLSKANEDDTKNGQVNEETERAKELVILIDKLLLKLE